MAEICMRNSYSAKGPIWVPLPEIEDSQEGYPAASVQVRVSAQAARWGGLSAPWVGARDEVYALYRDHYRLRQYGGLVVCAVLALMALSFHLLDSLLDLRPGRSDLARSAPWRNRRPRRPAGRRGGCAGRPARPRSGCRRAAGTARAGCSPWWPGCRSGSWPGRSGRESSGPSGAAAKSPGSARRRLLVRGQRAHGSPAGVRQLPPARPCSGW